MQFILNIIFSRQSFFYLLLILVLLNLEVAKSEVQDSSNSVNLYNTAVVPLSFIGVGLAVYESEFEKSFQSDVQDIMGNNFSTGADDFLIFAPVVGIYTLDLFGEQAKNHWFDQSKNLFFSSLISLGVAVGIKELVDKERPDGSTYDAFPSGHTTMAFTYATVFFNEFHETMPYITYSGYVIASSVGLMRIINNRHWLSDVLVGAGIGIISSELVYLLEPLKNFNPFKENEKMSFMPIINSSQFGLYFTYKF